MRKVFNLFVGFIFLLCVSALDSIDYVPFVWGMVCSGITLLLINRVYIFGERNGRSKE